MRLRPALQHTAAATAKKGIAPRLLPLSLLQFEVEAVHVQLMVELHGTRSARDGAQLFRRYQVKHSEPSNRERHDKRERRNPKHTVPVRRNSSSGVSSGSGIEDLP